jgi:hypothetical protein
MNELPHMDAHGAGGAVDVAYGFATRRPLEGWTVSI